MRALIASTLAALSLALSSGVGSAAAHGQPRAGPPYASHLCTGNASAMGAGGAEVQVTFGVDAEGATVWRTALWRPRSLTKFPPGPPYARPSLLVAYADATERALGQPWKVIVVTARPARPGSTVQVEGTAGGAWSVQRPTSTVSEFTMPELLASLERLGRVRVGLKRESQWDEVVDYEFSPRLRDRLFAKAWRQALAATRNFKRCGPPPMA